MKKNKIYNIPDYDFEAYMAAEGNEKEGDYIKRMKKMMRESSNSTPMFLDSAKKTVIPASVLGGLSGVGFTNSPAKGALIGAGVGTLAGLGLAGLRHSSKKKSVKFAKDSLSDKDIDKKLIEKLRNYKKQIRDVPITEVYYKD
jgi:hypothetical protein